ncbi:MAG: histidine kinase [Bacteroidota bacterium]
MNKSNPSLKDLNSDLGYLEKINLSGKFLYHKLLTATWLVLVSFLTLQLLITEGVYSSLFELRQELIYIIRAIVVGLFLIVVLIIPLYSFLKEKGLPAKIIFHFLGCFFYVALYLAIGIAAYLYLMGEWSTDGFLGAFIETFLSEFHNIAAYYFLMVILLTSLDFLKDRITKTKNEFLIKEQLLNARFELLKNQIQPHFLFNSLNGILSEIDRNKETAKSMVINLSELLRESLLIDYSKQITIEKELQLLEKYLKVEKFRYSNQLIVNRSIKGDLKELKILPFILQPLVENGIKHGFTRGVNELIINIDFELKREKLSICISNNGKPIGQFRKGLGILNLENRMRALYGSNFNFKIFQKGEWVINRLTMDL